MTIEPKRAMIEIAAQRALIVDHANFARRVLHALAGLNEFRPPDHGLEDARPQRRIGSDVTTSKSRAQERA